MPKIGINFEAVVDCTSALKAIGDIMMASNLDSELRPDTVGQLRIMIFETASKLEIALKISETSLAL